MKSTKLNKQRLLSDFFSPHGDKRKAASDGINVNEPCKAKRSKLNKFIHLISGLCQL